MAIRNIVKVPNDVLRKVCRPVDHIDDKLLTLLDDMAQTMYENDGVGLAAPQVGILKRVAVIDIGDEEVGLLSLSIRVSYQVRVNRSKPRAAFP